MDRKDFIANGYKTFYWSNGNKRIEGEYKDGQKVGLFKMYNQDGSLLQTIEYQSNLPHGHVKRYVDGHVGVDYAYDTGTLQSSVEYLSGVLVGKYHYGDMYVYEDPSIEVPPVGTILHMKDGDHPGELYKGTLWTFIENAYLTSDNGGDYPVNVWAREPNAGVGPYIYAGDFQEYYNSGNVLRTGSYVRVTDPENGSVSVLNGVETLWRDGGGKIYEAKWKNGVKVEYIELSDAQGRVWKRVNIDSSNQKYTDGIYNIMDTNTDGTIHYRFDPTHQNAKLVLQK